MSALKRIAMALALAAPGTAFAATDGAPGATSTGTFGATVTVTTPPEVTLRVYALEDFDFGIIAANNEYAVAVPKIEKAFCVTYQNRRPWFANITFSQISGAAEQLPGQFNLGDIDQFYGIPLSLTLRHINESGNRIISNVSPNTPIEVYILELCTPSNNRLLLDLKLADIPISSPYVAGVFNGQFSVLVAPR